MNVRSSINTLLLCSLLSMQCPPLTAATHPDNTEQADMPDQPQKQQLSWEQTKKWAAKHRKKLIALATALVAATGYGMWKRSSGGGPTGTPTGTPKQDLTPQGSAAVGTTSASPSSTTGPLAPAPYTKQPWDKPIDPSDPLKSGDIFDSRRTADYEILLPNDKRISSSRTYCTSTWYKDSLPAIGLDPKPTLEFAQTIAGKKGNAQNTFNYLSKNYDARTTYFKQDLGEKGLIFDAKETLYFFMGADNPTPSNITETTKIYIFLPADYKPTSTTKTFKSLAWRDRNNYQNSSPIYEIKAAMAKGPQGNEVWYVLDKPMLKWRYNFNDAQLKPVEPAP